MSVNAAIFCRKCVFLFLRYSLFLYQTIFVKSAIWAGVLILLM